MFGTLLGPEATGPGVVRGLLWVACRVPGLGVSGFLAAWSVRAWLSFPFLRGGVVCVRGCGTGLLFENYIVDASI